MTAMLNYHRCLGETIRINRKRVAISQQVLAERAGVTRRFIQELENGRSDVSLQTLMRLAEAMDMSLTEICAQIEQAMKTECLNNEGGV
jgi:transcriptional regulator with XRE-family HTH domain